MKTSATRLLLNGKLTNRSWFMASDPEIQEQLLELPENCNGFLADLATRPTEGGGVRLVKLAELLIPKARPIFGIFVVFQVQNLTNNAIYHYQYFSWKQGPESGAKGLLLIKDKNTSQISHLVVLRGFKFATGKEEFDCIGGFAELNESGIQGMLDRFKSELQEELGLSEAPPIEQIIDLGRLTPDPGMTNNRPQIFTAIISSEHANKIRQGLANNPDPWEMRAGVLVIPISHLPELVMQDDDGFLHICLNRLRQHNIKLLP